MSVPLARNLALVLVLAALPANARGQVPDHLVGQPVVSVLVSAEGRELSDAQARGLIEVRAGDPFSMLAVRSTIAHLMGLGQYLDVRVYARPAEGGVAVEVVLVPLRDLRRVVFVGNLGLPERVLQDVVTGRFAGPLPLGRSADLARLLEQTYQDNGYLAASVRPRPLDDAAAAAGELVYDVVAGPRAVIRTLTFEGSPDDAVATLRATLSLSAGAPYDPLGLQQRLEGFVTGLRAAGYLEARAQPLAAPAEGGSFVDLIVRVTRGPLVSVSFEGDPLPARQQAEFVPIAREASADQDLIEDSQQRIRDYFRAMGYRDALVDTSRKENGNRLTIVFTIRKGVPYRVSSLAIRGASALPDSEIRQILRVTEGSLFVAAQLEEGVSALRRYYRLRGFADVEIEAEERGLAAAIPGTEVPVAVVVTIAEGVQTVVRGVDLEGTHAVPSPQVRAALATTAGLPFYPGLIESDRDRLLAFYRDLGYRLARIDPDVQFSDDRRGVDLRYLVSEGPLVLVDHVLIVGNRRVGDATIRREVALAPGQPLGDAQVAETQRRLAELGLFRRVTISEVPHGPEDSRDVLVTVEEAASTSVGFGGGVEFQKVETAEFAPRGFFEVGRRNLWGKNRSVNFFSRLSLRSRGADEVAVPVDVAGATTAEAATDLEYRVVGSYREPKWWRSRADLQVSAVLEQGSRTSFSYKHRSARLDLSRRLGPQWSVLGQYAFERNEIIEDRINPLDKPLIDRIFPQVRLSSLSASGVRDTRDDGIDPSRGTLMALNGELALRPIGSEVGFAKTFLQGFIYRRLPGERRIVFAGGARLGIGTGFPRTALVTDGAGGPAVGPDGNPLTVEVRDLPISKRFFAGGDTTVRGFQQDRLGAPGTFDADGTPIGGHAEIVLNSEIRLAVWQDLGVVGFLDVGNVFAVVSDVSVGDLRSGAGFGIRYKSPIGPIRVDFGFKLGGLRTFNTTREKRFALHISIGQAF